MKSNLHTHPSSSSHRKFVAVSLMCVASLVSCLGCGSKQVLITPDYDNVHYRSDELIRPQVEVVETRDTRSAAPNYVGKAKVGLFNAEVPYLLDEPVSEFITKSINTMLGSDPQAEGVCPVTVHVDGLTVIEKTGIFKEMGIADCRLRFSFPVSEDSTCVTSVKAANKAGSLFDVTSSLEDLLYTCVADCTKQFLVDSYDPASSHLLVDRAGAALAAIGNPGAERSLDLGGSSHSVAGNYLQDPANNSWNQMTLLFHYFTAEDMNDAYSLGFGLTYMRGESLTRDLCYGIEIGAMTAVGTPVERSASTWTVDSSSLFSLSVPINIMVMYPPHGSRTDSFRPYVGIGGGGIIGIELMEAELSRFGSAVDVGNTIFRSVWTGEVCVGGEFGQWASNPFVEFRWLVSGRSNVSDGLPEEEDQQREDLRQAMREFDVNVNVNWPLVHYKSAVKYLQKDMTEKLILI